MTMSMMMMMMAVTTDAHDVTYDESLREYARDVQRARDLRMRHIRERGHRLHPLRIVREQMARIVRREIKAEIRQVMKEMVTR